MRLLLALVWGAGGAWADDVVRLPPWRVQEGRVGASEGADAGASSVVNLGATGTGTSRGLDAALGGVPGLMLLQSFGGFEPPRLSMRGSGVQSAPTSRGILLEVDGLPLNQADGAFNAALFDPGLGDRLEVYRGYDAVRVSSGVMGGVIDLSHDPGREEGGAGVSLQAGSWGFVRAQASAAGDSGGVALQAAVTSQRQDGPRPQSAQARQGFYASATRGAVQVSVFAATLAYDVPGPMTLRAAMTEPGTVSADVRRDKPHRDSSCARASVATHWTGGGCAASFAAGFSHVDDFFRQLQANGISMSDGEDVSWRGDFAARQGSGGLTNELRLGTEGVIGARGLRRYTNLAGTTGQLFGNDGLRASTASASLEDRVEGRGGLALSLGGSWLAARREIDDRMVEPAGVAPTTRRWSDGRGLAHGRVSWAPWRGADFYVDWAQSAEPPTFDDLLIVTGTAPALARRSVGLKTQTARTWEGGLRGTRGRIDWDLCLYRGNWDNEILRLADANGLPRGAINAGPTLHEGAEASLRWRVLEGCRRVSLETTAMTTRCTFSGDPVYGNGRLAGLPPHQGRVELNYDDGGLFGAVACDWTAGRTLADHAGRLGYGGQAIASLRVGRRWGRGWSCFAQMDNALGRRWIASTAGVLDIARVPAATTLFLPGAGRSVVVGVAWRR